MHHTTQRLKKFILDCIAPTYCLLCGVWGNWVCRKCALLLPNARQNVCPACFRGNEGVLCRECRQRHKFDALSFPFRFEAPISTLIHFFKYRGLMELSEFFGSAMAKTLQYYPFSKKWILVPVPLHHTKKRKRGFNQTELLAREIGHLLGIPTKPRALTRTHKTEVQATLSKKERENNLTGTFQGSSTTVQGMNIILIDDVATTLSTLNACTLALKAAGAQCVWAVVAARTP